MKILGVMRIKNEERWIRESIASQLPLCEHIIVFDDHSTDSTRIIVRDFSERCSLIQSSFEGVDEVRDKNYLLREHVLPMAPEWVLWIDGDEVLEARAPEIFSREMGHDNVSVIAPRILYFWDHLNLFRVDGCYASFYRNSLFRLSGQRPEALEFRGTGSAGFHCGNVPRGIEGMPLCSGSSIKHYGYLDAADRQRKFEWYNKIDPNNESEDCYRHMIETPGARHAPGPTLLQKWVE